MTAEEVRSPQRSTFTCSPVALPAIGFDLADGGLFKSLVPVAGAWRSRLVPVTCPRFIALAHQLNVSTDYLLGLSARDAGTVPMGKATPTAPPPTQKRQGPRKATPVT